MIPTPRRFGPALHDRALGLAYPEGLLERLLHGRSADGPEGLDVAADTFHTSPADLP